MAPQRTSAVLIAAFVSFAGLAVRPAAGQQETKPVPKDSVRVLVRGCTKGYVFTAGPRTAEEPTTLDIREGMHLRMNAAKKMMTDIKAHEGSMVELVGLMKKGQYLDGVNLGGGVRMSGAPAGGGLPSPTAGLPQLDVESWKPIAGGCRTK